jgi:hypothetical protein
MTRFASWIDVHLNFVGLIGSSDERNQAVAKSEAGDLTPISRIDWT